MNGWTWNRMLGMEWLNLQRIFCHVNPNYPSKSLAESEERHVPFDLAP